MKSAVNYFRGGTKGTAQTAVQAVSKNTFQNADELIAAARPMRDVSVGQQKFVNGNGPEIFRSITQGGAILPSGAVRMPDGTIISNYHASSTGVYTIFVNKGPGNIIKIRINP